MELHYLESCCTQAVTVQCIFSGKIHSEIFFFITATNFKYVPAKQVHQEQTAKEWNGSTSGVSSGGTCIGTAPTNLLVSRDLYQPPINRQFIFKNNNRSQETNFERKEW